jgi:hypothetical protein
VFLHGARRLAELAEQKLGARNPMEIRAEITPVFRTREGRRTDVVVLGCTHYPLLVGEIEKVAPWPVTYIDPALAIARRAGDVLRTAGAEVNGNFPAHTVLLLHQGGSTEPRRLCIDGFPAARNPGGADLTGRVRSCISSQLTGACRSRICLPVVPSSRSVKGPVGRISGRGGRAPTQLFGVSQ